MGYLFFQNAQIYKCDLTKWDMKPEDEHTWENFKTHVRKHQYALLLTCTLTVQEAINHTTIQDLIAQGVLQALQAHMEEILSLTKSTNTNTTPVHKTSSPSTQHEILTL